MIDSYKHKGQRKKLVAEIGLKGIHDHKVLDALNNVPRHLFMEPDFEQFAYKDNAFPIGCKQTISQPFTVAFQTQLMEIEKGDKVLEIGTGSGYQAAVLCEMGAKVYSIERHHELFLRTQKLLTMLKYRADLFYGDGYKGKPAFAPYDNIIITAAPPEIPHVLLEQLKIGGRLIVPVGNSDVQNMTRIIKTAEGSFKKESHGNFVFVPMLKGISK